LWRSIKRRVEALRVLIRPAGRSELEGVRELLKSRGLPHERFEKRLSHLFIAQSGGDLAGCVGLEDHGGIGLVRILAVHPDYEDEEIDRQLIEHIIDYARLSNMRELYAFADALHPYLEEVGFKQIGPDQLPPQIRDLPDFDQLCPEGSVCLKLEIGRISSLE